MFSLSNPRKFSASKITRYTVYQRRLDMRHHSCDIPKVFSHVPIDTEQL